MKTTGMIPTPAGLVAGLGRCLPQDRNLSRLTKPLPALRRILPVFIWLLALARALAGGQLVTWGGGYTNLPADLVGLKAVAIGEAGDSAAIRQNGSVLEWNAWTGAIATNTPADLTNVTALAIGLVYPYHMALKADGTVKVWFQGPNDYPRFFNNIPSGFNCATAIAIGWRHCLALTTNGRVVAWGSGNGANVPSDLTNVVAIAAGYDFSLALKADHTLAVWGESYWQGYQYLTPAVPAGLSNVVAICVNNGNCLGLLADGTVVGWYKYGSLATDVPPDLTNVVAVAAGCWNSLALRADGTVVAWGGQTNVPPNLTNVMAIASGAQNSLALLKDWPPTILGQPVSQTLFSGHAALFRARASSSQLIHYQWRCNGSDLPNATNELLILDSVIPADSGAAYTVVMSNWVGSVTSQPALLTVNQGPPFFTVQPPKQPLSGPGCLITLRPEVDGSAPFQYQWFFSDGPVPYATNCTLVISNATYPDLGSYTVVVKNQFGSVTSSPAPVYLPVEKAFRGPVGPLIWDFSGSYDAPLSTTLWQQPDGSIVSSTGVGGQVNGTGSTVSLTLRTYSGSDFWISRGEYDEEYVLSQVCLATAWPDLTAQMLYGSSTWTTIGQEYFFFLFGWVAYDQFTTNINSYPFSQPLPLNIDGHWQMDLEMVPDGHQLAGQAFITLSSSNQIQLPIVGTNANANKYVLNLQSWPNQLQMVMLGQAMTLQSMHGMVAGQIVNFDAPPDTGLLTLQINGSGTLKPGLTGQLLTFGKDYTLTAAPLPGSQFTGWQVDGRNFSNPVLHFTMASNLVITANFADVQSPALTITSPKAGQRWSNELFTVTGTVKDNDTNGTVWCRLNNGPWAAAGGWSNWSASVCLLPGTNTLLACAVDTAGNHSPTNCQRCVYVLTAPLGLNVAGLGLVTGATNGQRLELGRAVTLAARPATGWLLTNWLVSVDGVPTQSTNRATAFLMQSNLTITATFADVTRPILTLTTPKAGQRWSNELFIATGKVADNSQGGTVWYQLNGGPWTAAAGWSNWVAGVSLIPGTNWFSAFARDPAGNCSLTNFQSIVRVLTYWLPDYYGPIAAGNRKIFNGIDGSGNPGQYEVRIDDPDFPITVYTGKNPVVSRIRNVIREYNSPGVFDSLTGVFTPAAGAYYDYLTLSGGYLWWGQDQDANTIRFDPAVQITNRLALGQVVSQVRDIYYQGAYAGQMTLKLQLLAVTNVTVPAGTFTNCLVIRTVETYHQQCSIEDAWAAPGFGTVMLAGVSPGDPTRLALIAYEFQSDPLPPVPAVDSAPAASSAVTITLPQTVPAPSSAFCKRRLKSAAGVMCVTRLFKSAASSLTMKHVSQYERLDRDSQTGVGGWC